MAKATKAQFLNIDEVSFDTVAEIVGILKGELGATNISLSSQEEDGVGADELLGSHGWPNYNGACLMFEIPIRSGDPIHKIKKLLKKE